MLFMKCTNDNLTFYRKDCFGTEYFQGCVEALLLDGEAEKFTRWREMLGKRK